MRLWSLHASLLDAAGLVAVWREALLARNVLQGKTKGYKNHPQLDRFKKAHDSITAINNYLASIYKESISRGYKFDGSKIPYTSVSFMDISVTSGQLRHELEHLMKKCKVRNPEHYKRLQLLSLNLYNPKIERDMLGYLQFHNPIFRLVFDESIESWERVQE